MLSRSPSPRRAWIEITRGVRLKAVLTSPSPRRAWIEISPTIPSTASPISSPSPRRAWIEITSLSLNPTPTPRRPPHGGRGLKSEFYAELAKAFLSPSPRRAWIEMICCISCALFFWLSPSPRRAWIEIVPPRHFDKIDIVALPTEGVD